MPIIQVRAAQGEQWLAAPLHPAPSVPSIIAEWQKPIWDSELVVYPPDYEGNVCPEAWRVASNFLINVASSGESADVLALGKLPEDKTPSEIIRSFKASHPEGAPGSLTTINQANTNAMIAKLLAGRLVISGFVAHASPEELAELRNRFTESPIA